MIPSPRIILRDRIAPLTAAFYARRATQRGFLTGLGASCALAAQLFSTSSAQAASATWTGAGTDALWSNTLNWGGISPVPGTSDTATFNAAAGAGGAIIDLGAGVAIKTIAFDAAGVAAYTIGSGAVNSQTLTLDNGGTVTMTSTTGNNQLFNAAVVLGDAQASTYTVTNSSATASLTFAGTISGGSGGTAGAKTFTYSSVGGALVASGIISNGGASSLGLTKSGTAGALTLSAANTYTGATTLNIGTLTLNGANGSLALSSSAITLNGGTFNIDNTGAGSNNLNRIANGQAIVLNGGSLVYKGSDQASTASTETIGALSAGPGASTQSVLTVSFGGTNSATVTASGLTHSAGQPAFLINGVNLGKDSTSTASVARLLISGTAPTLVGTTAAAATGINGTAKDTVIVPYLVGAATATTALLGTASSTANTFLTYNATTGFRPLNPIDEFTANAFTAGTNVRITVSTQAAANVSVNSMIVTNSSTAAVTIADGATLTNTSGALLFTNNATIKPTGTTGLLSFGAAEGMITVNSTFTGTINAPITSASTGGITKSGIGTLILGVGNSYTGQTTVAVGNLIIKNATALGSTTGGTVVAGDNTGATGNSRLSLEGGITVTGEALTISGIGAFEGALVSTSGTNTWAGPITIAATGARIGASNGNTLVVSGVIDSGGNNYGAIIQRASGGTTILTGANTYVGDTSTFAGTLKLGGADNRLPVATRVTLGAAAAATFDLGGVNQEIAGLATAGTASNQTVTNSSATLSTLTVKTAAASPSTYGGAITSNLAVTKKGSDTLTLSGTANTYSGATTVDEGTLLISGSLNGTASVSVAAGATLASGSAGGSISASAATGNAINVAGTLSPGDTALAPITLTLAGTAKLNFDSGSQLRLDVGASNSSDTVTFGGTAGDFLSGSGNVTLALNGTVNYTSTYTVFSNVTTDGFAFAAITGYDTANYVANLTDSGTAYQLSFVAVPEPSALVSLLGGLGLLMGWRRRQA